MTHELPAVKEVQVRGTTVKWTNALRSFEDIRALASHPLVTLDLILGLVRSSDRTPIYTNGYVRGSDLFEALRQEGVLKGDDRLTIATMQLIGMGIGIISFNLGAGETEEEKERNIRALIGGVDKSLMKDFVIVDVSVRGRGLESYRYIPDTGVLKKPRA